MEDLDDNEYYADPDKISKVLHSFVSAPTENDVIQMCNLANVLSEDNFEAFGKSFIKAFVKRNVRGQSSLIREKFVWEKLKEVADNVPHLFHENIDDSNRRMNAIDLMIKDLEFSQELTTKFLDDYPQHRLNVKVNSVNLRNWFYCKPDLCYARDIVVRLPPELDCIKTKFEEFWRAGKPNASIIWHDELSHCTLLFDTEIGTAELGVSYLQAAVLFMFNDFSELTITEISDWTNIEESVLQDILKSLVYDRILEKIPAVENTYRVVSYSFDETEGFGDKQLHHVKAKIRI